MHCLVQGAIVRWDWRSLKGWSSRTDTQAKFPPPVDFGRALVQLGEKQMAGKKDIHVVPHNDKCLRRFFFNVGWLKGFTNLLVAPRHFASLSHRGTTLRPPEA